MNPRLAPLGAALAAALFAAKLQATITVAFNPGAAGVTGKEVNLWTFDVKWPRADSAIQDDLANTPGGASAFDSIRVAWYPQYAPNNGGLQQAAKDDMTVEVQKGDVVGSNKVYFLSPKTGGIHDFYVQNDGKISVSRWVDAMQDSRDYYELTHLKNITYNGCVNEPDNTGGKFTASIFVDIRNAMSGWSTNHVGPCSYNAGAGANWLPTIYTKIGKGTTHAIGGTTLADYKSFNTTALNKGLDVWNSEVHHLAEAIIAANLGFARGCYWGAINEARGKFIHYCHNARIFYKEFESGRFGATACYRDSANSLYIFIGNKDGTHTQSIVFDSSPTAVSFDGGAASTTHTITVPVSGDVSGNDERVIHVTW